MENNYVKTILQQIKAKIITKILCQHINVTGDGKHFVIIIVSSIFENKDLVSRHKLIYSILGDMMHDSIHALTIKTFSPIEWQNMPKS